MAKRHHPPFGAARSSAAAENRLDEWSRSVKPPSFRGQCNPGDSACISLPRASARSSPEGHGRLPRSSQTLRTVCLARPKRKRESTWSCSYFWWRRWESNPRPETIQSGVYVCILRFKDSPRLSPTDRLSPSLAAQKSHLSGEQRTQRPVSSNDASTGSTDGLPASTALLALFRPRERVRCRWHL